ncbi:hypothetical protein H0H92_009056 [Tricholoma furcatifolium]|nr:hypothetical protein H0H92_009056 [Tricholoma furcatifolium]
MRRHLFIGSFSLRPYRPVIRHVNRRSSSPKTSQQFSTSWNPNDLASGSDAHRTPRSTEAKPAVQLYREIRQGRLSINVFIEQSPSFANCQASRYHYQFFLRGHRSPELTENFATVVDDFEHIRQTVTVVVDARTTNVNSQARSINAGGTDVQSGKGGASARRYAFVRPVLLSSLPDLINPTDPEEHVDVDPQTSCIEAPARTS